MQPQQPRSDAKTDSSPAASAPANAPVIRRYPKPPALLPRMIFLCLKPEAWAAAARYPTRFTIIPLLLAILIAGAAIGISSGIRFTRNVDAFAANFPPMEVNSEGILKPTKPLADPLRFSSFPVRVVIDPSGKTTLESLKTDNTIDFIITDRDLIQRGWNDSAIRYSLASLPPIQGNVPAKGKTFTVDGNVIRGLALELGWGYGIVGGLFQVLADILWAAVIMFFLSPLITLTASLGQRSLLLPRRAAFRMAAALLIPLVLFNALMTATGYSILASLGGDVGLLFWFLAASAMAIWTGLLARKMFGTTRRHPPRQA